jgi:hypothetical protein
MSAVVDRLSPDLWKSVRWVSVDDELPDDEMTVILAVDGEPWTGFRENGNWLYVSADPISGTVTHWCEFPEVP